MATTEAPNVIISKLVTNYRSHTFQIHPYNAHNKIISIYFELVHSQQPTQAVAIILGGYVDVCQVIDVLLKKNWIFIFW